MLHHRGTTRRLSEMNAMSKLSKAKGVRKTAKKTLEAAAAARDGEEISGSPEELAGYVDQVFDDHIEAVEGAGKILTKVCVRCCLHCRACCRPCAPRTAACPNSFWNSTKNNESHPSVVGHSRGVFGAALEHLSTHCRSSHRPPFGPKISAPRYGQRTGRVGKRQDVDRMLNTVSK